MNSKSKNIATLNYYYIASIFKPLTSLFPC